MVNKDMTKMKSLIFRNVFGKPVKFNAGGSESSEGIKILPASDDFISEITNITEVQNELHVGDVFEVNSLDELPEGLYDLVDADITTFLDKSMGKVTLDIQQGDTIKVTVTSIESPDANTWYSLNDYTVDGYYHYVNLDETWQISVGTIFRYRHTPDIVQISGVGSAYRIFLNPSQYVDLSDMVESIPQPVQILSFWSVSCPSTIMRALSLHPVVGRFKAGKDDVTINIVGNIQVADNNPDIVNGHIYEYNIMDGVISWYDVTPVVA